MLDNIFIAVPIRYFETLIKDISNKVSKNSTIIDVCSVKKHTSEVMLKHLPNEVGSYLLIQCLVQILLIQKQD